MKHHLVIKLHRAPAESERSQYWIDFIDEKSVVRERVSPEIDQVPGRTN